MNRQTKLRFVGLIIGSLFALSAVAAVGTYFWLNSVDTKKDTVFYYLLISDEIKGCPIVSPVGEPIFTTDPGEGTGTTNSVFYKSSAPPEKIFAETSSYLIDREFRLTDEIVPMYQTRYKWVFAGKNSKIYLVITADEKSAEINSILVSELFE